MPAAQDARQQNDSDDFQHGKTANKNAMKYSIARRTALRIGDMPPSAKKALGGVHVMEPAMHREEMFAGYIGTPPMGGSVIGQSPLYSRTPQSFPPAGWRPALQNRR